MQSGTLGETAPGERISGTPYRVLRRVRDGDMGVVFEAEHIGTNERVAVELLDADVFTYEWTATAFRCEAHASARVGSPQIVDVLDSDELEDGRVLLVMPWREGTTLHQALAGGPMAPSRVLEIVRQICAGLRAAHDAGIVHHALGPRSVLLVEREGQGAGVELLGFGTAQIQYDRPDPAGRSAGSEGAPARGDVRVDIRAVGRLLRVMAPGAEELAAIAARCLHEDPEAGFQTVAELEAALEAVVDGASPKAAASSKRWPWLMLSSLAALVGLAVRL